MTDAEDLRAATERGSRLEEDEREDLPEDGLAAAMEAKLRELGKGSPPPMSFRDPHLWALLDTLADEGRLAEALPEGREATISSKSDLLGQLVREGLAEEYLDAIEEASGRLAR